MNRVDAVRIVICEDSPTYARALRVFLEVDNELDVVEICPSAEQLLIRLPELQPDLVTMDLELPGLDGVAAIQRIMTTDPRRIVVVSAHTERGSERAAAALTAGALEAIHKRDLRLDTARSPAATGLRQQIKHLAATRVRRVPRATTVDHLSDSPRARGRLRGRSTAVVAIGSSTGGPAALAELLAKLPADYEIPILVAQHISPGFTPGLARWLDHVVAIPVGVASHRQAAGPGVWFAPSESHLELSPDMTLSLSTRALGPHRPSVNALLTSVADRAGRAAVAVILTGMGSDGADGVTAIRAAGGFAIAQDEETSIVNGMPAAAIRRGAELVMAPAQIGAALATLAPARRTIR